MSDTGTESKSVELPLRLDPRHTQVQITQPCQDCVTYRVKVDALQRNIASGNQAFDKRTAELDQAKRRLLIWRGTAMEALRYITNGGTQKHVWGILRSAATMEQEAPRE